MVHFLRRKYVRTHVSSFVHDHSDHKRPSFLQLHIALLTAYKEHCQLMLIPLHGVWVHCKNCNGAVHAKRRKNGAKMRPCSWLRKL